MLLQGARAVFASTPAIGFTPCKTLIQGDPDTGEKICRYFNMQWICDDCLILRKTHPSIVCWHRLYWRPAMHSPEVLRICQIAYGKGSADYEREIMGAQVETSGQFLHQRHLDRLAQKPLWHFEDSPQFIFITVDPSGTTTNFVSENTSDYALITTAWDESEFVVRFRFFISSFIYLHISLSSLHSSLKSPPPPPPPSVRRRWRPWPFSSAALVCASKWMALLTSVPIAFEFCDDHCS